MHRYLLDMLACPACQGELEWAITRASAGTSHIEDGEARCRTCAAAYPVRDGIGVFLLPGVPRNDLWDQADNGLTAFLRDHPDVARQLMDPPLAALGPADQFFRALVHESQGRFDEARAAETAAHRGIYSAEYLGCWQRQLEYVVAQLAEGDGPVVDLASGRGYLAERLLRQLDRPVVFTDFSLRVLRADRARLQASDLLERASLLAFDARHTPFKTGAVTTLTTNVGLPNIAEPGALLAELRRITAGTFLAVSHFYPDDDAANREAIRAAGLETFLYRASTLAAFAAAGWHVEVVNSCTGLARPTPAGVLLAGATIDTFPVAETQLEWCVLHAQ